MAPSTTYFGYPIPDCTVNEDECARCIGSDIRSMSAVDLNAEKVALLSSIGFGRYSLAKAPNVFSPNHVPIPFDSWARDRLNLISKEINRRSLNGRHYG